MGLVLERLGFPVLLLVGRLEGRVLTNGSVGIGVDLLDIIGTNAIREISGELLLEARKWSYE